jgi:enolase
MAKIEQVIAREILDTHGNPTIETTVVLSDGTVAKSSVPTGIMKGTYEVAQLRDGDSGRFSGQGVLKAVEAVNNEIAPKIIGMEATEQQNIDKTMLELDGTQNKMKLGGNSILSVSQAVCKAAAKSSLLPLVLYIRQFISVGDVARKMPTPMFNVIEGGKHAENTLNFQEFLVIPASSHDLADSLEIGVTVYKALRQQLKDSNQSVLCADEGGFGPSYSSNADAFKIIRTVVETTKYEFLKDVFLGVDIAANAFLSNKKYAIKDKNGQLDQDDLIEIYQGMVNDYSLVYFEDPFAEDDWEGWKKMYTSFASKALICGDDITSTNPYRLQNALTNNVLNAIVVKPNQIGTVTEALAVAEIAKFKQLKIVVSSRSGETEDNFIVDFAVAVDADYVKFGAPARERVAKYNRLMAIEQELLKSKLT